jgi:hypothetical protein
MSYYIRFLLTDKKPISLATIDTGLKQKDAAYSIERDDESDDEGELTVNGDIYGQIEINRSGDEVFDDDINFLKESASEAEGERKLEVLQVLDEANAMIVVRVLWQGREPEETVEKISLLWDWLFENYKGLVQAENEGYYNASELILEVE